MMKTKWYSNELEQNCIHIWYTSYNLKGEIKLHGNIIFLKITYIREAINFIWGVVIIFKKIKGNNWNGKNIDWSLNKKVNSELNYESFIYLIKSFPIV